MSVIIFVGDVSDHTAALAFDKSATLLTSASLPITKGVYYTSIADITKTELVDLSLYSEIKYGIPLFSWSSTDLEFETLKVLHYIGVEVPIKEVSYPFLFVPDRVSNLPQIWIPGCGYPCGAELDDKDKTFGSLLSNELNMPATFLAKGGSSIQWAADQILRADIREGDIVVWALTGADRFPYYQNDKIRHVRNSTYKQDPEFNNTIPESLLESDHHWMAAITFIEQVKKQAEEKGYTLLLSQFLLNNENNERNMLTYLYQQSEFMPMYYAGEYIDYAASDSTHPGPLQHHSYYVMILAELKRRGITT